MHINTNSTIGQYHPITNPQTPAAINNRQSGENLPLNDTVTLSNPAKSLAELDALRTRQKNDSSRSLAYGELIYVGPPDISLEEARSRMDLWDKYQNSPTMDSFKRDTIKLYETEKSMGTVDNLIGNKLMALYEKLHSQLANLKNG